MHLNGRFVVFGRVISGKKFVDLLDVYGHGSGKPTKTVVIADCGTLEVGDYNSKWHED